MRELKFRCFYRGRMYFVDELQFYHDGSFGVGSLTGLDNVKFSPDSEHVKGVMQSTCLKDKNGNVIYDGDILGQDYGGGDKSIKVVEYMVFLRNVTNAQLRLSEVIGNIYENPELLK